MKPLILALLFTLCAGMNMYAQPTTSDKVPPVIRNAFKAKYPKATDVRWEIRNITEYEASFRIENQRYLSAFNSNAKCLKTELYLPYAQVPEPVKQTIQMMFEGYQIRESYKVESIDYGNTYKIVMKKGTELYKALLQPDGKLLTTAVTTANFQKNR